MDVLTPQTYGTRNPEPGTPMIFPPGLLIFAHRGASGYAPENTLPAFTLAADMGAHGIEFDVQITRDGKLVVHHDRDLGRTEAAAGRLRDWRFADLRALDVGAWFDARFAGTRMPTPAEVVEAVGDRLLLNFELVNDSWRLDGVEEGAVALFRRMNLFERAMVSSFNPRLLWAVRRAEPRITLGALWGAFSPWHLRADWWRRRAGAECLHPESVLVTPAFVAQAHAQGRRVHTWTVNDGAEAGRLRALGVDMIMGDFPDRLG